MGSEEITRIELKIEERRNDVLLETACSLTLSVLGIANLSASGQFILSPRNADYHGALNNALPYEYVRRAAATARTHPPASMRPPDYLRPLGFGARSTEFVQRGISVPLPSPDR